MAESQDLQQRQQGEWNEQPDEERRKKRHPGRLNHPVDGPAGMGLAQRSDGRKGVQDVSHGAQPDDKEAKLGLSEQALIFSQGWKRS